MLGANLITTYDKMRELGLVRSKRDYCRWLGRGKTYLRDIEFKGRDGVRIPMVTVMQLRARLKSVANRVPSTIRMEIDSVIASIDQGVEVADLLYGYRRT